MTLDTLLEEIKYGKEYVDSKKSINELEGLLDEDYQIPVISTKISKILSECDLSKPHIKKLIKAARGFKDYEDRILEGKDVSSIYTKMKVDTITEDINSAMLYLTQNKKELRESNQKAIAKSVALLKFGINFLSNQKSVHLKEMVEFPTVLKPMTSKELKLIESFVN